MSSTPTGTPCAGLARSCPALPVPAGSRCSQMGRTLPPGRLGSCLLPKLNAGVTLPPRPHRLSTHRSPLLPHPPLLPRPPLLLRPPLLPQLLSLRGAQAWEPLPVAGGLSPQGQLPSEPAHRPHGPSHSCPMGSDRKQVYTIAPAAAAGGRALHGGWEAPAAPPQAPRSLQSCEGFAVTSENTRSPAGAQAAPPSAPAACGFTAPPHGSQPRGGQETEKPCV